LNRFDHNVPKVWFQRQLQPVFGIDVFATAFPKERGYAIYATKDVSLLVIKLEMLEECASQAMRDFLGIDEFLLRNSNIGEEKEYKDMYKSFLRSIALPDEYLNRMYNSEYAQHFYTDAELQHFRMRWSVRSDVPSNEQHDVVLQQAAEIDMGVAG
jgi:hypothetical protein